MKVLLLGGNEGSGKSDALIRLHDWLQGQGFQCSPNTHDTTQGEPKDFICFMSRITGTIKHVILNSAADDSGCIKNIRDFITNLNLTKSDENELLLISAIRRPFTKSYGYNPRKKLLDYIMQIFGLFENDCVEIPVTHIHDAQNYPVLIQWHEKRIDETIHNVLQSPAIGL